MVTLSTSWAGYLNSQSARGLASSAAWAYRALSARLISLSISLSHISTQLRFSTASMETALYS